MDTCVEVFHSNLCLLTGKSLRGLGMELRCRCIETESQIQIRPHIRKVEFIPANSHCEESEIM